MALWIRQTKGPSCQSPHLDPHHHLYYDQEKPTGAHLEKTDEIWPPDDLHMIDHHHQAMFSTLCCLARALWDCTARPQGTSLTPGSSLALCQQSQQCHHRLHPFSLSDHLPPCSLAGHTTTTSLSPPDCKTVIRQAGLHCATKDFSNTLFPSLQVPE